MSVLDTEVDVVIPPYTIFMGADKHENEHLIRWGWPEDLWFHVDNLSSAHVYLRLHEGETIDDIPQAVIDDCAQLVKANSIQGNKMNNVDVVYTMWTNLKKTGGMDVGQVGFHSDKQVRKVHVERKLSDVVKRLEKTRNEVQQVDLQEQREQRDHKERLEERKRQQEYKVKEKEEQRRKEELADLSVLCHMAKQRKAVVLMATIEEVWHMDGGSGSDSDDFM